MSQTERTPALKPREMVNHPSHYGGDVPHEIIKCLHAWGLESDALLWNSAKYIGRAGKKDDILQDLKKARFYLDRRIQDLEAEDARCDHFSATGGDKARCIHPIRHGAKHENMAGFRWEA